MTVEEVRGSLDSTDNGAVKNSIRNCLTVFQNDPKLEGAIRYNILTERIDIVKPLWWSKPTTTLNDTDLNYLMLYLEDQYTLTSEKKIQKAISIVADCNKYHPIRDYLNGLEWDGTERIRCALPHFLGAEESEFTYECLRLFMLGAISRVFKPGSKFEPCSVWWAGKVQESPPSSGCWQSRTSGSRMTCGGWTMTTCTASCKVTGSLKCRR